MEFTCTTNALAQAIDVVSRAITTRPVMQAYENMLLDANGDALHIYATDGSMYIAAHVPAQIMDDGIIALDGKLFSEFIRKQSGMEITLTADDKDATIKSGRSKTQIALKDADSFPGMPKIKPDAVTVTVPANALRECIDYVQFAVSNDHTRKVLTGILLEIDTGEMRTVGLDGFRMALMNMPCSYEGDPVKAILPRIGALEFAKLLKEDGDVSLTLDGSYMAVVIGNYEIRFLLVAGEYINYAQIIPKDENTRAKVSGRDLRACAERAQIMARDGKNNLIQLDFCSDKLIVTSRASTGNVYEEMDCELQGDPITIAFNCAYLLDAMKSESGSNIEFSMTNAVRPAIIRNLAGKDTLQMLLPVRSAVVNSANNAREQGA